MLSKSKILDIVMDWQAGDYDNVLFIGLRTSNVLFTYVDMKPEIMEALLYDLGKSGGEKAREAIIWAGVRLDMLSQGEEKEAEEGLALFTPTKKRKGGRK